jgi:hypothetical protein
MRNSLFYNLCVHTHHFSLYYTYSNTDRIHSVCYTTVHLLVHATWHRTLITVHYWLTTRVTRSLTTVLAATVLAKPVRMIQGHSHCTTLPCGSYNTQSWLTRGPTFTLVWAHHPAPLLNEITVVQDYEVIRSVCPTCKPASHAHTRGWTR